MRVIDTPLESGDKDFCLIQVEASLFICAITISGSLLRLEYSFLDGVLASKKTESSQ